MRTPVISILQRKWHNPNTSLHPSPLQGDFTAFTNKRWSFLPSSEFLLWYDLAFKCNRCHVSCKTSRASSEPSAQEALDTEAGYVVSMPIPATVWTRQTSLGQGKRQRQESTAVLPTATLVQPAVDPGSTNRPGQEEPPLWFQPNLSTHRLWDK